MSSDQDPDDTSFPVEDAAGQKALPIDEIGLLRKSGDVAKAIELLEEALAQTPNDAALLKDLANARFSIQDDRGAIEALERVRAIKPLGKHTAQLYQQATRRLIRQEVQSLRQSGDVAKAIELLEERLVQTPNDVALLKDLANARFSIKDDRGTIIALDRVIRIGPLGEHSARLYEQASLRLRKQHEAESRGRSRQEAQSLRQSGQVAKAIELLEKLLLETPDDVALLKDLANARFALQDDLGAIKALDHVRRIGPLGEHTASLYGRAMRRYARKTAQKALYYLDPHAPDRMPVEEMVETLSKYDLISFDIFDTAILRAVAEPQHVFRIMGARLSVPDFAKRRKQAEAHARAWNDRTKGTREVTLDEIYAVMAERDGATEDWKRLEKDLEIQLTRPHPEIFKVYERLRMMGKRLIFTSDMYLPRETLETMLARAGYRGYERIYLSHEHGARKGDGTLQRIVIADNDPDCSIVHIGDVYEADVRKSIEAGIAAVHNPNQFSLVREKDMSNLAGSVYSAVINNTMGTSTWTEGLHYTHGFRVGGFLALGYVEYLEQLAKDKGIDRILFLGRDCDILSQIYTRHFGTLPSSYIATSRIASLALTTHRNFDDYISRTFFRWYRESNNTRPLSQLLHDSGFAYLIDEMEAADIEPLQFSASANESKLRDFFWSRKGVIEEHLAETRAVARDYFAAAIGDAKSVLAVDIGWTGTCIATLRDFLRTSFGEEAPQVFGALLGTSRNDQITDAISDGSVSAYIYSPVMNQDITRLMMPEDKNSQEAKNLLTHPVEYLFTEPEATTIGYARDAAGQPVPVRGSNLPPNPEQIRDMQRGILDFVDRYLDYSKGFEELRRIPAYSAFQPLRNALGQRPYLYAVYKDFLYDAAPVLYGKSTDFRPFGDLFHPAHVHVATVALQPIAEKLGTVSESHSASRPKILFVSPEMTFTGTPHSLLRLCKVAKTLGYEPLVWTARQGPFSRVFEQHGFAVQAVSSEEIDQKKIAELQRGGVKLVVCNTVVTDGYVRALEGKLPLVWYVREATNVPQLLRGNPDRADMLRRSSSITVVSDYAAEALRAFVDGPVEVVKNAVEDACHLAQPYTPAKNGVVRFVQLGTVEHRKGYDLFVAAYKAMPASYRARSELHFAGGFINSGTSFASYLFGQMKDEPGIRFHGLIDDEQEKVEFLSQMDVVVVASRDESCSLVALEGTMLAKPLIVTENVGAKYMVGDDNGITVPSGDVMSLRDAFMRMIDLEPRDLIRMGAGSRRRYDALASMENHRRELETLFTTRINMGPRGPVPASPRPVGSATLAAVEAPSPEVIVSLTSFPPRMPTIAACIASLKVQTRAPDRILLWLSLDQFPGREADLPETLLGLVDDQFTVRWVEGDLAPHKKYFHAMQEVPNAHVITVDDDVAYDKDLVATLYQDHLEHPDCIVTGRANLIRFRPDGRLRAYDHWGYEHQHLRETETYALLPTGIGGVLYPAGSVPAEAFDIDVIHKTCLHADDLWLKFMTTANGYPVWMPQRRFGYPNIDGSQDAALWRGNWFRNGNDSAIEGIMDHFDRKYGTGQALLRRIQGVRPDGTFVGPGDDLDQSSLLK